MSEEIKATHRRVVEEIWNKKNLDAIGEMISSDYVNHSDGVSGHEEYRGWVTMYITAFPDLHLTIEDQVAEGNKTVNRLTARGTHQGDLMGIPPTGKQIEIGGMFIVRIVGGKVVEEWGLVDVMGMMRQLGVA
jgi:steroid delta-isomerase-like uncharacterized protein